MKRHPDLADLYGKYEPTNKKLTEAFARGILAAGQAKERPNQSLTKGLTPLIAGVMRGVLLTRLQILQFQWIEGNGLRGSEKRSVKELHKLVMEQYQYLRGKLAKMITVKDSEGTPAENLKKYLESQGDLFWEILDEVEKSDDGRLIWSLIRSYREGLIRDEVTGETLSAETMMNRPNGN